MQIPSSNSPHFSLSYNRNRVFAFFIILVLFLQLTINRAEEPYPAILFPGGGQTITNSKSFIYTLPEYRFVVHTNSNDSTYIDKYHLFNTLPESYVAVSYRSMPKIFNIESNDSDSLLISEAKKWLKKRLAVNNFQDISHLEIEGYLSSIYISGGNIDSVKEELIFDSFNINLK